MLYYFNINTCIVTTVSGVCDTVSSDTLTQGVTLHLQLVIAQSAIYGNPYIEM